MGRVGGPSPGHVMSDPSVPGDHNCNHNHGYDSGDVLAYDIQSENTISQVTDGEFEHDTADYQWLLDYE